MLGYLVENRNNKCMQSVGCGIIFNPLFVKKNGYGTMAQRQYKITQCNTHTQTQKYVQ